MSVALAAGCIAGGIEAIAVWPMEYMKTQLQLSRNVGSQKPPFTTVTGGLKWTLQNRGFLALYRGLDVTLLFSIPKAGIRFGANDACKKILRDKDGKLSSARQFLAGVGAGVTEAIFAVTPMETVKTKLIETNSGLVKGVKAIVKEDGIGGLYKGLSATILKQSTNQGFRFMAFNKYKDYMLAGRDKLSPIESLVGGMASGCFSTICNNPFDVVKTQMQGMHASQYSNTFDCFKQILKTEGPKGFYKGVIPRLGRVVPGQGIIFMSYESIADGIRKAMEK